MSTDFALDHTRLSSMPAFTALAETLSRQTRIDSPESFNRYCREACRCWHEHFGAGRGKTSALFGTLREHIDRHDDGTIPTVWGGVVVTLHEHPRVEKYLVILRAGYLALEKHAQKDEHLEVREGAGLLLSRRGPGEPLAAEALEPGGQFHLEPEMEHCIIGTENLLVFERSHDPKGMDQDLIFIYEPDGNAA